MLTRTKPNIPKPPSVKKIENIYDNNVSQNLH